MSEDRIEYEYRDAEYEYEYEYERMLEQRNPPEPPRRVKLDGKSHPADRGDFRRSLPQPVNKNRDCVASYTDVGRHCVHLSVGIGLLLGASAAG